MQPDLRTVLDTNLLVAWALTGDRPARRGEAIHSCVQAVLAKGELLASDATLAELRAVLLRPGFERYKPAPERKRLLARIEAKARLVQPAEGVRLCRDPEDDMFLAVALAADADWLVTVDKQLLSVRGLGRTRIVRPERFLESLAAMPVLP